jgi:hypothetical protein
VFAYEHLKHSSMKVQIRLEVVKHCLRACYE